ncbi:MAG: iron ABC transporter permease [Coriobacteriia bacterium]|nr:iron ABC transporter permease [Coriobacteriia bacterium]MCL2746985.1 iron ABC transporter permease [Coriobacteriia bacterium]MCL2870131.1 iron ABC transporter permease [Coriobacteriia bacterium]
MVLFSLAVILVITAVVSASVGSSGISPLEVVRVLFGAGADASRTIVLNVRIPQIATGIAVGVALAMAGCIMQNVLRNPLASASTLGIAQGASFGAAVAIVFFQAGVQLGAASAVTHTITSPYLVVIFAFLGGIATTAVILLLARVSGVSPTSLILAGVALSAMFTAGTALIQYFADDIRIASIVHWTFGNLGRAGWNEIAIIFAFNAVALIYFIYNRWNYNAIEAGNDTAKSLGVNVDGTVLAGMTISTLISAVAIAFVGTINFIGLIAPHIVRRLIGNDYRFLIPCSALMGAIIILVADIASRTIASPAILPIGALTSFMGAPLFLYLIIKQGKKAA